MRNWGSKKIQERMVLIMANPVEKKPRETQPVKKPPVREMYRIPALTVAQKKEAHREARQWGELRGGAWQQNGRAHG